MLWENPQLPGRKGKLRCGGVLIRKRFVLTAAHCIEEAHRKFAQIITVKLGKILLSTDKEEFEQERRIDGIIVHPGYNRTTLHNDIALLRLNRGASLTRRANRLQAIQLLNLPGNTTGACLDRPGTQLYVTGYGLRRNDGWRPVTHSDALYQVVMPIVSQDRCKVAHPNDPITDSMICSGDGQGSVDSCHGDSGGPAAAFNPVTNEWQLVGLTSWGPKRCAVRGGHAVVTRVSKFISWISKTVQKMRRQPAQFMAC